MNDTSTPQKHYCRLCAKYEICINIFSVNGMKKLLAMKISTCLPIQINKDDNLPKGVCSSCISKLDVAYELVTTCVLVQSKLEELNTTNLNSEEVSSSVLKPLPPPRSTVTQGLLVLPLTLNNVAQFNKLSSGIIKEGAKEEPTSSIPVISSVLTLACAPPKPPVQSLKHDTGQKSPHDEGRAKKERKTVCFYCKNWYPRSKIEEHEKSHL